MIRPRGFPGVAFGESDDGDPRSSVDALRHFCGSLGVPQRWAFVDQVHGSAVVYATEPGNLGDADGIVTITPGLPIAIATADCVPIALVGEHSVAIVHAGWRGVASGVVREAVRVISDSEDSVVAAAVGPHIGPCCYEVGAEVVEAVGGFASTTTDGGLSVDLGASVSAQLPDVPIT
ncbi:MAG: polyphenol oxidase family protein, partial [Actinomycetota bacterium]